MELKFPCLLTNMNSGEVGVGFLQERTPICNFNQPWTVHLDTARMLRSRSGVLILEPGLHQHSDLLVSGHSGGRKYHQHHGGVTSSETAAIWEIHYCRQDQSPTDILRHPEVFWPSRDACDGGKEPFVSPCSLLGDSTAWQHPPSPCPNHPNHSSTSML